MNSNTCPSGEMAR